MTREGLTGILTAFLTMIGLVLGMFLPPEYQPLIVYILMALEAVGMIAIWFLSRKTVAILAGAVRTITREGFAGLLTALLTLVGLILSVALPPEIQPIIPYILTALEAVGMIVIFFLGRKTGSRFAAARVL